MRRQQNKSGWHEVVRVVSPMFLVTARQDASRYETVDGKPLGPGYYLALWPSGADYSSYGREVRYLGPFATQAEARLLQTSALALDIVETATPSPVAATHGPGCRASLPPVGADPGGVPATLRVPHIFQVAYA